MAHVLGLTNIDNQGLSGTEKWIAQQCLVGLRMSWLGVKGAFEPVQLSLDARVQHIVHDELTKAMALYKATTAGGIIRDNKPMNDASLRRCLQDGLMPEDWYRILNARVFFWLSKKRLLKLLAARSYAQTEHEVITIDARPLVEAHRCQITLSLINSGATGRFPVKRGLSTFLSLDAYPYAKWRRKRTKDERAVELAVLGGVPDIARFTRRVVRMKGDREVAVLFEASQSP
ncbi:hypothetical protein NGM99_11770 [Mesorhizobium sp. RP14(2022)]|uniref:Uncharacterized protein n=1 Tax=Mesorhizobium liriopis TaxID=2953882 RepID=A0ABT1C6K8_9HYPH|nr:hypothetical protein [Mesorhizobium liriopis]MCO6050460.1 hypothetical protein [Mesorhizobium liriopis]